MDLLCHLVINPPLFRCLVLYLFFCPLLCLLLYLLLCLLLCPLLYSLLFFVLNPLLFCCLIVCSLWLHLKIFLRLVIFLFFVAEFQLFACNFLLYMVYLFFLYLHLSNLSNNPYQMSLRPTYQSALQSLFVYSRLLVYTIWTITMVFIIQTIITNVSEVSRLYSSTLACRPAIMIKKRWP